jgi:hypothetical protein
MSNSDLGIFDSNIDPAILDALKMISGPDGESLRVAKVRKRNAAQVEAKLETQMELLADEVERIIPRNHKLFEVVLMLAMMLKVKKITEEQEEPEYKSALEQFPPGW